MRFSVLKLARFAVVPAAISGIACSGTSDTTTPAGGTSSVGRAANGGSIAAGGSQPMGGALNTGGANNIGGVSNTGGSSPAGGAQSGGGGPATGGSIATGGTVATGGDAAIGGAANTGGAAATGGSKATGGAAATGGSVSTGTCGSLNSNPFSRKFAWGDQANGTNVVPASNLNFSSIWVGYETNGGLASASATAANNACDGCTFVTNVLKASGTPLPSRH